MKEFHSQKENIKKRRRKKKNKEFSKKKEIASAKKEKQIIKSKGQKNEGKIYYFQIF